MPAGREAPPRVLVIIPTHDHARTIPWAIRSVQEQSIADWELVIIGDGVGDDTRAAVAPFVEQDARIRFEDHPKGERHGERYRHGVILASTAPIVAYVCDDDLLLPWHLESMLETLGDRDFANPLPAFVGTDGEITVSTTDLARPDSIAWHFQPGTWRNSVSLTGVLHTRAAYERLPHGWRPAPKGRWTDHYMWEQFFALDGFRARTAERATTAKFHASSREQQSPEETEAELAQFWTRMHAPGFEAEWDRAVARAVWRTACDYLLQLTRGGEERDAVDARLASITSSVSWRVTRPLRAVRALLRREYS